MPRPSAASSKRPDHHGGDRALRILGEILRSENLLERVQQAAESAPARQVRLPAFDLFSRGVRSPYEWCVPRPRDEETLLNVYEEYVDRELGIVPAPEKVAKRLYGHRATSIEYFGKSPRLPQHWYVPAVKLVAAAQHFDAEVTVRGRTVSTCLMGYTMMVSPRSYHSNIRRASLAAARVATDLWDEELKVPMLQTRHRLAVALVDVGANESALWAANTAIRAERIGSVDTMELFKDPVVLKRTLSAAERLSKEEAIRAATLEATEIATDHATPVPSLYEAMVPTLCTSLRFKALFGHPWQHPDRAPKPETRREWVARIEAVSTEALNAIA